MRIRHLLRRRSQASSDSLVIGGCPLQQVLIGLIPSDLSVAAPVRLASDAPFAGALPLHRSLLLPPGPIHGSGETLQTVEILCAGAADVVTKSRATPPCASRRICHV